MNDPMGELAARPIVRARCFLSQKRLVTNDRSAVNSNRSSTRRRAVMPNLPIVGIGASAGGGEAVGRFFQFLPAHKRLGLVGANHPSPHRGGMLVPSIRPSAPMP